MKREFIRAFYVFQGVINLVFAFLFVRLDTDLGGSGGGVTSVEFTIKGFLVVVSCLSFLTALILIFRGEVSAKDWARATSVFGFFFYEAATIVSFAGVALGRYDLYMIPLIISVVVLFLNAACLYFLHKILKTKRSDSADSGLQNTI